MSNIPDELANSLIKGLEDYLVTETRTKELNQTLEKLQMPNLFLAQEKGLWSKASCLACNVGLGVALRARRRGVEKEKLVNIVEKLCVWLKIESEPVCHGAVLIYAVDQFYKHLRLLNFFIEPVFRIQ